jgi:enoyl-CoA hydratase
MFEMITSETTPEGVLVLTLNDPATRNSLTEPLSRELSGEVERFRQDADLRVLVITGADPAFCSGANVRGFNRSIEQREAAGGPRGRAPGG